MLGKVGESAINMALGTRFGRAVTGRLSLNRSAIFMLHRPDRQEYHQTGHQSEMLMAAFDYLHDNGIPIVPLSTLVEHYIRNEPFDRFSVAFTIDDGFEDQGSELLPLFIDHQVAVTTFLITNLANGNFWPWDYKVKFAVLNTAKGSLSFDLGGGRQSFDTSTLARKRLVYRLIVQKSKTLSTAKLIEFLRILERETDVEIPDLPPDAHRPLRWEQVRKLEQRGVQFGPHSMSHRSIVHLTDNEAAAEISGSWRCMQENLVSPVPIFCWPIGRQEDYSLKTMQIAKNNNLLAGLSAESGYINMNKPPATLREQFAMPRFPMPNDTAEFSRIISGLSGLKLNRETLVSLPTRGRNRSGLRSIVPISRYQLKNAIYTLAFHGGVFSRWSHVDWSKVNRLVFICKGNICRSPYAEYRARSLGIDSISSGIEAGDGATVPSVAQECASFRGIDLSLHRSNPFDVSKLQSGDLVLGMEPEHISSLGLDSGIQTVQFSLLGIWKDSPAVFISDPFGQPITEFFRVFASIDRSLAAVQKELKKVSR